MERHVKENVFFGLFLVALVVAIAILITGHMRPSVNYQYWQYQHTGGQHGNP